MISKNTLSMFSSIATVALDRARHSGYSSQALEAGFDDVVTLASTVGSYGQEWKEFQESLIPQGLQGTFGALSLLKNANQVVSEKDLAKAALTLKDLKPGEHGLGSAAETREAAQRAGFKTAAFLAGQQGLAEMATILATPLSASSMFALMEQKKGPEPVQHTPFRPAFRYPEDGGQSFWDK